jgi:ribonuclease HI
MHIFTDGSSKLYNDLRTSGVGVYCRAPIRLEVSEPITSGACTNSEAEWIALTVAVLWTIENWPTLSRDGETEVVFCTDSNYVLKSITEWIYAWEANGWKSKNGSAPQHLHYAKAVDAALRYLRHNLGAEVSLQWVKAHTSGTVGAEVEGNREADLLAGDGRKRGTPGPHRDLVCRARSLVSSLERRGSAA